MTSPGTSPVGGATPDARITLYTRAGCHLCEVAKETIDRVAAEVGTGVIEIDIDADPALIARFGNEIPVTFVDGRQHDFYRVDEARLRAALDTPPA